MAGKSPQHQSQTFHIHLSLLEGKSY